VGGGDAGAPFYRVVGGVGRSGVRGERAVAVVHHNGGGGDRFRGGSGGVVVRSDEGVLWLLRERKGAPGGGARVHLRRQRWPEEEDDRAELACR
jgi:hypothetical protein